MKMTLRSLRRKNNKYSKITIWTNSLEMSTKKSVMMNILSLISVKSKDRNCLWRSTPLSDLMPSHNRKRWGRPSPTHSKGSLSWWIRASTIEIRLVLPSSTTKSEGTFPTTTQSTQTKVQIESSSRRWTHDRSSIQPQVKKCQEKSLTLSTRIIVRSVSRNRNPLIRLDLCYRILSEGLKRDLWSRESTKVWWKNLRNRMKIMRSIGPLSWLEQD